MGGQDLQRHQHDGHPGHEPGQVVDVAGIGRGENSRRMAATMLIGDTATTTVKASNVSDGSMHTESWHGRSTTTAVAAGSG